MEPLNAGMACGLYGQPMTAQQAAGAAMLNSLASAVASGASGYTIAPGTYRISSAILLQNTSGFTLNAPNVEIIAENNAGFFTLFTNRNLTVRGPLTLDSNPINTSQGGIVSVDAANNSVNVQVMAGYAAPAANGRIMVFDPNGMQLPHWHGYARERHGARQQRLPSAAMELGVCVLSAGGHRAGSRQLHVV